MKWVPLRNIDIACFMPRKEKKKIEWIKLKDIYVSDQPLRIDISKEYQFDLKVYFRITGARGIVFSTSRYLLMHDGCIFTIGDLYLEPGKYSVEYKLVRGQKDIDKSAVRINCDATISTPQKEKIKDVRPE